MTPLTRSLLVGVVQLALVGSVGAKFLMDRQTYPRVWIQTRPIDPDLPIRGRYVRLAAVVHVEDEAAPNHAAPRTVRLEIRNGALTAVRDEQGHEQIQQVPCGSERCWVLVEPLAYFIAEHVPDPSRTKPGAQLWVEASLPPHGPPRPIRLGLKEGDHLSAIDGDLESH